MRTRVLALSIVATLVTAATGTPASALSCFYMKDPARLRRADVIIDGRIEALRPGRKSYERIATVRVQRAWKGARRGQSLRVTYIVSEDYPYLPPLKSVQRLALAGRPPEGYRWSECLPPPGETALKDYNDTWMRLQEAATREPDSLTARRALADFLSLWSDDAGALRAYDSALRLTPRDPALLTGRGQSLARLGRFKEADAAYGAALDEDPNHGRARLLRIGNATRDLRGATSDHKESQRLAPRAPNRAKFDLTYIQLKGADLRGVTLSSLDFIDLTAPASNWAASQIGDVGLARAMLANSDLAGANFFRSNLAGADLSGSRAAGAQFNGVNLSGVRARGLDAPNAQFSGATLAGADFAGANLAEASFSGADAYRASFEGADLTGASLTDVDLRSATFGTAKLERARLGGADLRGADLGRVQITGADLARAKVDCATRFLDGYDPIAAGVVPTEACPGRFSLNFDGVNFGRVSFAGVDLRQASFRKAQFIGGSFADANLDGVDFTGAAASVALKDATARNATFVDVRGHLDLSAAKDVSNAVISGASMPQEEETGGLRLILGLFGPAMTGTHVSRAYLKIDYPSSKVFGLADPAWIAQARFEDTLIDCAGGSRGRGRGDKPLWTNFITALDLAQRVAAQNPTATLDARCRREVQRYLGGGCRAGRREAGFAYACPAPIGRSARSDGRVLER